MSDQSAQRAKRSTRNSLPTQSPATLRLNKFIAQSGVASRRKADELIEEGLVTVNGHVIRELGTQIRPGVDYVKVKGKLIHNNVKTESYLFNKPIQVLTTMSDPEGRPTVADYFTKTKARLFPVGRLDWNSEGLLIMTNDGDLAQRILHPTHGVAKTYLVKVRGKVSDDHLEKLRKGVSIVGGKANAEVVHRLRSRGADDNEWLRIIITEGRNRQIRRMFEKIGSDVLKLQRVAIGRLKLGSLRKGASRPLNDEDIRRIFAPVDFTKKPSTTPPNRQQRSRAGGRSGGARSGGGRTVDRSGRSGGRSGGARGTGSGPRRSFGSAKPKGRSRASR